MSQTIKDVKQLLIKNNIKMKDSNDKENEVAIMAIPLDFKKKPKSKPNTDRTHNLTTNLAKKDSTEFNAGPSNSSLLEKKKQYSMAIRQKNMNVHGKKVKNEYFPEPDVLKNVSATQTLKSNSTLLNDTVQSDSKQLQKDKSLNNKKTGKENELKSKVRDVKREMTKIKKMSAAIEDFKSYGLKRTENDRNFFSRPSDFDPNLSQVIKLEDFSMLEPTPPPSNKFTIVSQQVSESISPFVTEQMKQIQLLRRQNATFKKELATFRKQNGTIKRELQQHKKQIQDLKEKNDFLTTQSQDNIKLLQSFQLKVGESFESICHKEDEQGSHEFNSDGKIKEILASYQNQLFQANSQVKKLEFRNYMLEKRLLDESEAHKKIMAREISMWKQRYIKARNENLRLKDSRNSMLFEMSISEEM